jgi:hypothetical protein
MFARTLLPLVAALVFWPPWLSIEAPTNPFDPSTRDAVFLVHAMMRGSTPKLADLAASAEGMVGGARETITLRLDTTSQPGVFAVRKQWPTDGTWIVCVTLAGHTTALVALDPSGRVASVRVPTESGDPRLPRAVSLREIDSTLAALAPARGR